MSTYRWNADIGSRFRRGMRRRATPLFCALDDAVLHLHTAIAGLRDRRIRMADENDARRAVEQTLDALADLLLELGVAGTHPLVDQQDIQRYKDVPEHRWQRLR